MSLNIEHIKELGDYVRYLSLMGVQKANSGHPGLPLGCAEIGCMLYNYFLNGSDHHPTWPNRDRFILSAGHGSMLLYALNYLYGYNIRLEDIANFRQLGSKAAGHPEYELKDGIETTTGPLGQGFANAVGVAIEAKMLAARFNTPDFSLFNFNVYTLMGDGCAMEGITNEAASIAGFLGLDNLIALYDSNNITIDGDTQISFTEDVAKRYTALGWRTAIIEGTNLDVLYRKIRALKALPGQPKLLIIKTVIGEGLNQMRGSHKVHGAPAGTEEIDYFLKHSSLTKYFSIDATTISSQLAKGNFFDKSPYNKHLSDALAKRTKSAEEWQATLENYQKKYPEKYEILQNYQSGNIPNELKDKLFEFSTGKDATRGTISTALQIAAQYLPQIVGGSADLVSSTKATVKGSQYISHSDFSGRNIAFGVRERAMGAIGNGLALNRNFIPFTSTFFTFIDYMKPAVRLSAIMQLKHLFIFTHDSIYVGEDGPTHEPIEHLGATRLIPGIHVFRPANDVETGFSLLFFLEQKGPIVILGSRQNLDEEVFSPSWLTDRKSAYLAFKKGAYIFSNCSGTPNIILAGSGSEISTLLKGKKLIEKEGKKVRLVSIPCLELFQMINREDQKEIMGDGSVPVILMEAASHIGHKAFYHEHIHLMDIETFGESGNGNQVAKHFGFSPEAVYEKAKTLI